MRSNFFLSVWFRCWASAIVLMLCSFIPAQAAQFAEPGASFYLLADSAFASKDEATVRLEADTDAAKRYGGVDMVVYRVPDAMAFLKKQKDLHKLDLKGDFRGDGAANAAAFLWDEWYVRSRRAWQRVFSSDSRTAVTKAAPALKAPALGHQQHIYKAVRQYKLLDGFELVSEFRYPLQVAQPIDPKQEARLPGSSSEFLRTVSGNVRIPLGKLAPGLYIVEGYMGTYRAVTLLFVSDTVLVTKVSGEQMLAWTAQKQTGTPVAKAELAWSDGNGVLKSGKTDEHGVLIMEKRAPEQNNVFGVDPQGGVFIAENFYYPAEVYNAKLYMVTDRPLYRPGDTVQLAVHAREFTSARKSTKIKPATGTLALRDPAGTDLLSQSMSLSEDGGVASVVIPDNAVAGGYDLRLNYRGSIYAAPIRVAEYTKPHYDIELTLDRDAYKAGEAPGGIIKLRQADGSPVGNASVDLILRSQRLSMVNGEPQYQSAFPIKLKQDTITLDAQGQARFTLPAATEPSRYVIKAIASQDGAYPVSTSREIQIGSAQSRYRLQPDKLYTAENEPLKVQLMSDWPGQNRPAKWSATRLEDRSQTGRTLGGTITGDTFTASFAKAGSYQINVTDAAGVQLGQLSHSVTGPSLKTAPGAISILFDRERYQVGDTANVTLTFPEDVNDALLTIELENVQQVATLQAGADWLKAEKINARQWRLRLPVSKDYQPNVTFSALFVKNGAHVFANRGFAVAQPGVELAIKPDKPVYKPGDTVTLNISTRIDGKGAPARLSLGVVDEMVYLLQPEITPEISDFFYHPRRDAVRTSASLNFYGYDLAFSPRIREDDGMRYNNRSQKMLVRPRRDNIDTAYWNGQLKTDANGQLQIKFRMPDALTRWRMTARAIDDDGVVGQRVGYIQSDLPAYLQWNAPQRYREGDAPALTLAVRNQVDKASYTLVVRAGNGPQQEKPLTLPRGTSYVGIDPGPLRNAQLVAELKQNGKLIDRLITDLHLQSANPERGVTQLLTLNQGEAKLSLPADASQIRLRLLDGEGAALSKVIDQLIDYPYGCVEQTASRLLPLTLAWDRLKDQPALQQNLRANIAQARLRLLRMSGPDANFSWWGDETAGDPLLSAYARLAEQRAAVALGVPRRLEQDKSFLQLYAKQAATMPVAQQALTLWLAQESGQAIRTPLQGLLGRLNPLPAPKADSSYQSLMNTPDSGLGRATAFALAGKLAAVQKLPLPPQTDAKVQASIALLQSSPQPWLQALAGYAGGKKGDSAALLGQISEDAPTLERSLALLWLASDSKPAKSGIALTGNWRVQGTRSGDKQWLWSGKPEAISLKATGAPDTLQAELRYTTAAPSTGTLPVKVTRRLYELQPAGDDASYTARKLEWNAKLSTQRLYLDEIELESAKPLRYGLIEAALPPGALVEEQHFGLHIANLPGQASYTDNDGNEQPLLQVQPMQDIPLGYAQPVALLDGKVVLRQIVRFTQGGRFTLPAARLFGMYAPQDVAYDNEGKPRALEIR